MSKSTKLPIVKDKGFMKDKYKLKKWYPSLPKDWEVGMEVGIGDRSYGNYSPCNGKYKDFYICAEIVENYPEFWEKVVEKDWEVLKTEYIPGKRGFDTDDTSSMYKITSIKRKCDREIFSVGDKLYLRDGEVRKITGISLDDSGVSEFSKRDIPWLECGKDYGTCLDWAVHYKEPILITEDRVEIFEGDDYWRLIAVLKNQRIFEYLEKVDEKGEFPYRGGGGLFFSTKEMAEKYIEENKPMYTKKDMLSFGASMSSTLYPHQCEGCLEQWKKFKKRE